MSTDIDAVTALAICALKRCMWYYNGEKEKISPEKFNRHLKSPPNCKDSLQLADQSPNIQRMHTTLKEKWKNTVESMCYFVV